MSARDPLGCFQTGTVVALMLDGTEVEGEVVSRTVAWEGPLDVRYDVRILDMDPDWIVTTDHAQLREVCP